MQQLQFEAAWDKTIAVKDRVFIEQLFEQTKDNSQNLIQCVPVRVAVNHRNQLLVTVLIHNFQEDVLRFMKTKVGCHIQGHYFTQLFTIPALVIPPKASMPWTFIFEVEIIENDLNMTPPSVHIEEN
ncbi:SLAP domain-containing protein [Solibacillus sp. FSL R7-0682]|uniref:SLAP domain-containing protein n=1 Tax=Solibacillus sp. FSL R7-0682 TaxID=2921690 RepID=UPI0030FB2A5D